MCDYLYSYVDNSLDIVIAIRTGRSTFESC